MSRPRRKLSALDDPLESADQAPGAASPVSASTARRRDGHGDVQPLFVRIPAAQGDALARAAFELRLHKQEIVAALIDRHVDTSAEGLDAVLEMVDDYRAAHG
jgi:hypothetical protein